MTGRAEPTDEELSAKLHKRMFLLEHGPGSHNDKRYNRQGVGNLDVIAGGKLHKGHKGKQAAAGLAGAAVGASGAAAAS